MKYALRNIFRLPSKSVPVFLMIFLLLFVSSFGFFISGLCREKVEKSFGILKGTALISTENQGNPLSYSDAEDISAMYGCITDLYASSTFDCELGRFTVNPETKKSEYENLKYFGLVVELDQAKFYSVCGLTDMEIAKEFISGECYMKEGFGISGEDNAEKNKKAVISDKFAELNNIGIGDEISIAPISLYKGYTNIIPVKGLGNISLTVGGIYSFRSEYDDSTAKGSDSPYNRVYLPMSVLRDIYKKGAKTAISRMPGTNDRVTELSCDEAYFKMTDTSLIPRLQDDLAEQGIYNIRLTEYTPDSLNSAASRLANIIGISMIFVIIVSFLVLALLLLFGANSRKRELTVLCALGQSRRKTAANYLSEVFILFLAALILTFAVFSIFVCTEGTTAAEYINSEKTARMIKTMTASEIINNNPETYIFSESDDISAIFEKYIIPDTVFSMCIGLCAAIVSSVIIYVYIKKLEIVASAGGKE